MIIVYDDSWVEVEVIRGNTEENAKELEGQLPEGWTFEIFDDEDDE